MTIARHGKLRVVLDPNVYFSAFNHKGVGFSIWQKAVLRDYILLISPAIFQEVGDVPRLRAGWEAAEVIRQLKLS
jgi:predicted nucleic acid-binding protein